MCARVRVRAHSPVVETNQRGGLRPIDRPNERTNERASEEGIYLPTERPNRTENFRPQNRTAYSSANTISRSFEPAASSHPPTPPRPSRRARFPCSFRSFSPRNKFDFGTPRRRTAGPARRGSPRISLPSSLSLSLLFLLPFFIPFVSEAVIRIFSRVRDPRRRNFQTGNKRRRRPEE